MKHDHLDSHKMDSSKYTWHILAESLRGVTCTELSASEIFFMILTKLGKTCCRPWLWRSLSEQTAPCLVWYIFEFRLPRRELLYFICVEWWREDPGRPRLRWGCMWWQRTSCRRGMHPYQGEHDPCSLLDSSVCYYNTILHMKSDDMNSSGYYVFPVLSPCLVV